MACHEPVGFGVSQAAESLRFQLSETIGCCDEVEAHVGVHGVSPLAMGIKREDRRGQRGLQTWKAGHDFTHPGYGYGK